MADTTRSATSSMTSTSHTLTHDQLFRVAAQFGNSASVGESTGAMEKLSKALEPANRHTFIEPSIEIFDAALESVKKVLDGVAGGVCDDQAARLRERKRKRGDGTMTEGLRIRKVHTEGFRVEQVWEQTRRVIDALRGEVARELDDLEAVKEVKSREDENDYAPPNGLVETMKFDEDGFEMGGEGESLEGLEDLEDRGDREGGDAEQHVKTNGNNEMVHSEGEDEDEEEVEGADTEMDYLSESGQEDKYKKQAATSEFFIEDPNGLNDGFFSIEEFNKQTEFLEQQDAAADPYTGEASDEEDIDWDADPMSLLLPPPSSSRRAAAMDIQNDESESGSEGSEDDGPTFGNADLQGLESGTDEAEDGIKYGDADYSGDNTNNILYKDFFEPPPRKVGKGERQAKYLDRQARKSKPQVPDDDEAEMKRAISDVRRDLFDHSEAEGSGDVLSDADPSEPKSRRSAHERRQAKLAEEIRRLEAAAVAKREWTLSGEARAADRPLNSLLEEDLDFERTGKPVPVITTEISESIEELIKRRILAQEFDEVIRRRPDSESVPMSARRGVFELDDSKPQQSLAEIYEEEHVKATNPDTYMSKVDTKLKKQHQEIELLWKDVSAKLDTLSSWHYKPKPPAPSLTIIADVATITMEDAQPTTASEVVGGSSMLAPQEIYKAGQEKSAIGKGELVRKSGVPVARGEMTREEKLRRRRREKERIKKRGGIEITKRPEGKRAKEKKQTVEDLKKGGVKVIGRRGDIRDIDGNKVKPIPFTGGAAGYKL